ncbi:MAG TPA: serine/threonine-protein kinase [Kofleriaceae bacterium]|nr:serine/threonine-protein kinase [Kofleriaceae bacterium]
MTELPTTFGKYYLTEKLATGGMAEIFLGKIIGPGGFEKQLVIKQIHPSLTGQRHFVDLFVAEAKTLVGLAHGNIVPLYELGVIDDTYFIAMEYIDGPTLWRLSEAMARRGDALEPGLALHVAAELAKGLDYAHRKGSGVIHRDLSPRNVMLSRDGEVKLVDFGIAVTYGGGEGPSDDAMPTGSFPYMSPEQVARRPLTGQSDLFSLGVLLWELLVGERLFARATPEETLAAVATAPIPEPSARRATVPKVVDAIVLRCLERDTAKRWKDAGELSSALHRALYSLEPTPGARDVAAVVARYCPPLGREDVETSAELGSDPGDESAGGVTDATPPPATDGGGPSTQVMDRDGKRPAKGKRKPTIREATFATSIDFEKVLSRATPLVPLKAILEEEEAALLAAASARNTTDSEVRTSVMPREPKEAEETRTGTGTGPGQKVTSEAAAVAERAPRTWLWAGLVVIALAVVAIWWIATGRQRATAIDAGGVASADATVAVADDAGTMTPSDGDVAIVIVDAATEDAGSRPPRTDAGTRPSPTDAGARLPPPDAAAATTRATGKLKVGAVPWGEVYVDGKKLPGQAPKTWDVPAGPHTIEIVFPATEDEPEIRKRFDVVVPAGGEETVSADFSR